MQPYTYFDLILDEIEQTNTNHQDCRLCQSFDCDTKGCSTYGSCRTNCKNFVLAEEFALSEYSQEEKELLGEAIHNTVITIANKIMR
ncbi:MAG: hypothetical protein AB1782_10765 [Cyanobacteriota bacterium]